MITYDIDLCLGMDNQGSGITVKCCDTGVNIRTHLFVCRHGKWRDTHEAYTIPAGCTPVIKIAKPDKTYFIKDGIVQAGGVLFETKPQAFTASGTATAEVSLYAETGERITTASFTINIPPECTSKCEGESGNYVDVMSEQIRAAVVAAEKAEQAAKSANDAAVHPPKLSEACTWLVWNAESGGYVDTGVSGKGKDGADGKDGRDGAGWNASYKITGKENRKHSKWCRVLNLSRVINGTLNLNLLQGDPCYMAQNVSLDVSGYVRWEGDTQPAKPVIVQNHNNIYGVDDVVADPLKQSRITKIRVAYPKRDADYGEDGNFPIPNEEGEYQNINNPVYCYIDALVEFDRRHTDGASSPTIYVSYSGMATSKCVPITEQTVVDDSTPGRYGEQLDFFEFELNKDIDLYMPARKMQAKEIYAENLTVPTTKTGNMIRLDDVSPIQGEELTLNLKAANSSVTGAKATVYGKNLVDHMDFVNGENCVIDSAGRLVLMKNEYGYTTEFAPTYIPANTPFVISCVMVQRPSSKPNMTICIRYADGTASPTKTYVMGTVLTHTKDIVAIRFGVNTALDSGTFRITKLQVELGEQATEYVEPQRVTGNKVDSLNYTAKFNLCREYVTTIIIPDGFTGSVTYSRDIVKAFEELQNAIISLGGNV